MIDLEVGLNWVGLEKKVGDRGVRVPLMADVEALGPCACRLVRVWRASCGPFEGSERLRPGRRGP